MIVEISVDDGHVLDAKVASMLNDHGLRGTFYIPYLSAEISSEQILLIAENHDIGGHTMTHPSDLKQLSDDDLRFEVETCRQSLQDFTGQPINSFCYPRGRYDERVIQAVMDAGYTNARTTKIGHTKLEYPTSASLYERYTTVHLYQRPEYDDIPVGEYAQQKLSEAISNGEGGYFHLWMHSWEVERDNHWQLLDNLLTSLEGMQ